MKLTAFTDYSLRVLIYLAAQTGRRATIAEIATAFGISQNHLMKVVNLLARQGYVSAVRGKGGGLRLARPPAEIVLGRVVRDTEGPAVTAECFEPGGGGCVIAGCCHLSGILVHAVAAFYAVLDRHTLADLVVNRQAIVHVLHLHRPAMPAPPIP